MSWISLAQLESAMPRDISIIESSEPVLLGHQSLLLIMLLADSLITSIFRGMGLCAARSPGILQL